MIRKFNYTGRSKIPLSAVVISRFNNGYSHYFHAKIDLKRFKFPSHAKVYIEAYVKANNIRFNYGTVGNINAAQETTLDDLPSPEDALFQLKVVDESEHIGRILGIVKNIRPDNDLDDGQKDSILPVKFDNLNHHIWKVDFDRDMSGPVLVFNFEQNIPGIKLKLKNDPVFIALVYPAAIRFVLNQMAKENMLTKDSGDWSGNWIKFTESVLGIAITPESNDNMVEVESWIDEVVNNFCLKYRIINRIKN